MARDAAAGLSALLQAATMDDDEVLKAANAAIKADRANQAAHHTRAVALLKLDRFDDAIRALSEGGAALEARCRLERAYALYKAGRLDDAAAAVESADPRGRGLDHVAAQVAYCAERFADAEAIYARLLMGAHATHEGSDLGINRTAALAQSEWQRLPSGPEPPAAAAKPDSFELCYNTACAHIARASLATAAALLQRAARLCDASDDLSDQEKTAELKPILAQQAYVYARLGNMHQALDLYRSLEAADRDDADLAVVALNNKCALEASEPANPFLLQRHVAACMAHAANAKLLGCQSSILARNASLVNLQAQKVHGVKHRTRSILEQAREPTTRPHVNDASVINAAAETRGLDDRACLRQLLALLKKRPSSLGLVVTTVQLHLRRGHAGAALSVLESFLGRLDCSGEAQDLDVRFSPGLVALAVSLMRAQARDGSAFAELVKAATYWRDRPVAPPPSLLREAGIELARSSNPDHLSLAAWALQKLRAQGRCSPLVSAGLVAVLAASDASSVEQHVADLPPVESLTGGIDVDMLTRAGVALAPGSAVPAAKRLAPNEAAGGDRAAKRRTRRRLPTNYVEGTAPDPERWLPLRDRSTYRPKGKKGKSKAGESTQGGIVKEEETLELVGGGGVKVEKAPAAANSSKKKGKK